jgi:hypothetical protein
MMPGTVVPLRRELAMSVRKAFRGALIFVVYVVIILAGLEVAVRIFRPQTGFGATVNTWDPDIGVVHIPNARRFLRTSEFDIDLVINSKGLRDREFPYEKPRGTRRILSLGDSFAAGYGVEADETYAKVLERRLRSRRPGGVTWEVLNAAVGSTGTAHQLAYYVKEGRKYSPDIVLVGFFVSNDFWDTRASGLYALEDGRLVKRQVPLTGPRRIQRIANWIPGYNTLFSRSHLLNLLKVEVALRYRRNLTTEAAPTADNTAEGDAHSLTWRVLREFRDVCAEDGALLVILVIPAPAGSPESHDQWEADVARFADAEGIACLNLGPAYRARIRVEELNFPFDRHWNARGHEFTGDELFDFLIERGLVEERTGPPR